MALPLYLAMTRLEMGANSSLPEYFGFLSCHFSPYGTGLSNMPAYLPEGAMLIVDDSTPIFRHDKQLITNQLLELVQSHSCSCVLLDFQRPFSDESYELAKSVCEALPCPVGVSEIYAKNLGCPIFLPPVPLDVPIREYIKPWEGREIWLEAALDGLVLTLTEGGCHAAPLPAGDKPEAVHQDEQLHCHYNIHLEENAQFTLFRTRSDLDAMLGEAEALGITRAVGLWQELNPYENRQQL